MFFSLFILTFLDYGDLIWGDRRLFFPRGVQPYISHIGMCRPHQVGFLGRFGFKKGIHFPQFGLESGMVFVGTTECINVFIISIPKEKERKRNMRIRNGFE